MPETPPESATEAPAGSSVAVDVETSIFVRQKYRGLAAHIAVTAAGAVLIVVGFLAGMRSSMLALLLFLTGCLVVVAAILKLAIAMGDRKPVLVLAPRELIDARRPAYDQALPWTDIQKLHIMRIEADGAEPVCRATLSLSPGAASQSAVWRIDLSGLEITAAELIEVIEHRIAAARNTVS